MKKKTYKIIICICLAVMLFASFGNIFAATNPDYTAATKVSESDLEDKIKSNVLLDNLASMINALASLAEYLLGAVFKTLTGDNIFPWADRIIFNGIGFLDINFLNPASNSLFVSGGTTSILGKVVLNVYTTIFSLAVLFLGVAVGIMAIRLAISSIAAEKAKYKQAIVNWATCIVMLFLMHYILAFVFWINEQLVQVASGILISTIEDTVTTVDFSEALDSVVNADERIENYCKALTDTYNGEEETEYINVWKNSVQAGESTKIIANALLTNDDYMNKRVYYVVDKQESTENKGDASLAIEVGFPRLQYDVSEATIVKSNLGNDEYVKQAETNGYYPYDATGKRNLYFSKEAYLKSEDFKNDLAYSIYVSSIKSEASKVKNFYVSYPGFKINVDINPNKWQVFWNQAWSGFVNWFVDEPSAEESIAKIKESSEYKDSLKDDKMRNEIADSRLEIDGYIIRAAKGSTNATSTTDIIANLGKFFKETAYTYATEKSSDDGDSSKKEKVVGWRATKVSVTGALLYAIFIFQSCMYFIMYVKRLFYVMMLSMFGPIVVIYDFFMKSAG